MGERQVKEKIVTAVKHTPATSVKSQTMIKNPEAIEEMFGKIAGRYDLTNGIVSFQLHRLWNQKLAKLLKNESSLLDLCAGTGDIAYRWLSLQKTPKTAILLDFCEEMLNGARSKSLPYTLQGHNLSFIQADATLLPLPSDSVDAVSIAYGIRNIKEPDQCFKEAFRVLKPRGHFAILELTEPKNPALKLFHTFYLNQILPLVGGLVTKEKAAYRYLAKSVQTFAKPSEIKQNLRNAGFQDVSITPLLGGIATLFHARKK